MHCSNCCATVRAIAWDAPRRANPQLASLVFCASESHGGGVSAVRRAVGTSRFSVSNAVKAAMEKDQFDTPDGLASARKSIGLRFKPVWTFRVGGNHLSERGELLSLQPARLAFSPIKTTKATN